MTYSAIKCPKCGAKPHEIQLLRTKLAVIATQLQGERIHLPNGRTMLLRDYVADLVSIPEISKV